MEHRRTLIQTTRIPIRWGDMDAFGHVNNTVYFRYAEQARVEWLEGLPGGLGAFADGVPEVIPVIVNASCTFQMPIGYPGVVEVRMYAGVPGRSSLPTYYEMRVDGDDRVSAEGAAKMVWMSTATGRSVALPGAVRSIAAGNEDGGGA
jgi:acyl-CoA thioester hydrolase